jgi:hypothetical protein
VVREFQPNIVGNQSGASTMKTWIGENGMVETQAAPFFSGILPIFWISSVRLHSNFNETFGGRFPYPRYGLGWGPNRRTAIHHGKNDALFQQAMAVVAPKSALAQRQFSWTSQTSPLALAKEAAIYPLVARATLAGLDQEKNFHLTPNPLLLSQVKERKLFRQQIPEVYSIRVKRKNETDLEGVLLSLITRFEGRITVAAANEDLSKAMSHASRALYLQNRKLERIVSGQEQALDLLEDQRLILQGTSARLAKKTAFKIERAQATPAQPIFFDSQINFLEHPGDWSTEYRLLEAIPAHHYSTENLESLT